MLLNLPPLPLVTIERCEMRICMQPGSRQLAGKSFRTCPPLLPRFSRDLQSQQHPLSQQIYSFVPIPGAQQHKRPRRRYEEIERMYKCGWNGCEKAYGTLNHLNAHVTMQSHGQKRTPEGMYLLHSCSSCIDFYIPP